MCWVTLKAYAKINLHLAVFPKKAVGATLHSLHPLHPLGSLFHSISLADTLTIVPAKQFSCEMSLPAVAGAVNKRPTEFFGNPLQKNNTITRMWAQLKQTYQLTGEWCVRVEKNIPLGAGLGGGSSDAASFLNWVDKHYKLRLTWAEKCALAQHVGSDVPFFLKGGMAWVEGCGEHVETLQVSLAALTGGNVKKSLRGQLWIVENELSIATALAYEKFATLGAERDYARFKERVLAIVGAWEHNDEQKAYTGALQLWELVCAQASNAFQAKTLKHYSALGELYQNLCQYSHFVSLTGSGSAFFAYTTRSNFSEHVAKFPGVQKLHPVRFLPTVHS